MQNAVSVRIMTDPSVYSYRCPDSGEIKTIQMNGHKMLVRKCRNPPDMYLAGPAGVVPDSCPEWLAGDAERMEQVFAEKNHTNLCQVLAMGPKCNTSRSKSERRRLKIFEFEEGTVKKRLQSNFYNPATLGDFVCLPEVSDMMWGGVTPRDYDFIIDESIILFIVPNAA